MKKFDKGKQVILTLQIPESILNELKEKAFAECASVSYLVRRAIMKELNSGE